MAEERNIFGLKKHNEELKTLTRESIISALMLLVKNKSFEQISVTDICNKAGVSRNAFYKNFSTKENVFMSMVSKFNHEIVNRIGNPFEKKATLKWYVELYKIINENLALLHIIIDAGYQGLYLDYVNQVLTQDKNLTTKAKYHRLLWNGAIQNTTVQWIKSGQKESIEEIAKICYDKLKFLELNLWFL